MDFSTSFELWLVGCSMLFGAAGMLLYDGFRIWRQLCPAGRAALFLQDLLFWLLLSAGCVLFLLVVNQGQPRLFIFAASLLGALLYHLSLSRPVMLVGGGAARGARKGVKFLVRLCKMPLVKLRAFCDNKNEKFCSKCRARRLKRERRRRDETGQAGDCAQAGTDRLFSLRLGADRGSSGADRRKTADGRALPQGKRRAGDPQSDHAKRDRQGTDR
ncbi:MAG: spore cortex biosynthesis protein YabQ [Clostridia bacterium]|nr:spore cortex biosynthesis protein YabQ [Clostridia bacterium]